MGDTTRTLLFDLDGTLTDNFEGIANCIRYALTRMDVPHPDLAVLRACVGPPLRETLPRLIGSTDTATTERAIALYRERFSELGWRENAVYAGVPDMLAAATQAGPRAFLCTSKPQRYAEKIVRISGCPSSSPACTARRSTARSTTRRTSLLTCSRARTWMPRAA